MAQCPSCGSDCAEGKRFCGDCGAAIDLTSAPTETSFEKGDGSADLSPASPDARFIPGTILAKRYRIVGLLGRGGMGEVYRADDLKLGQPVALKFLHAAVDQDQVRLERFMNEVKSALRVTHPNICRVYDIGEVDGHHYLSMEYVDGEDLASLLRRIGRLPQDKAVQIARQLCAGLAAAHEQGILHRDLKPANVMIDGRGRAKITDFGLAGLAADIEGVEIRAGTPQYMSPEQHAGKEVTVLSDIYSLGLLLYELCTGKPAFEGRSAVEIRELQEMSTPTSPSSHVAGLDPVVERVILRCLETDPAQRPASALAVAAALPGGDPLAAALAAGETPSPEMVAAAGEQGSLHPIAAVTSFLAVLALFVAVVLLSQPVHLQGYVPMDKHPEALVERARQVIDALGLPVRGSHSAYGYRLGEMGGLYLAFVAEQDRSADRWEVLRKTRPAAVEFWYRQSVSELVPWRYRRRATFGDPPQQAGESIRLGLDMDGRLTYLRVVPPSWRARSGERDPDWGALFEAAGLHMPAFKPVEPDRNPPEYCESLAAWEGTFPERPDVPMWVRACAYGGVPTYFISYGPWMETRASMEQLYESSRSWTMIVTDLLWMIMPVIMAVVAVALAIRHLRIGRGDRRGAMRVAVILTSCLLFGWLISPDHVGGRDELYRLSQALAFSILTGVLAWVYYMALEPFVRRHWPSTLVSWSRLLAGRFNDPLVGRDILIGQLFGLTYMLLNCVDRLMGWWMGISAPRLMTSVYPGDDFLSFGRMTTYFLDEFVGWLLVMMGILLGLALLRALLRRRWAAIAVIFPILVVWGIGELSEPPILSLLLNGLMVMAILFSILRFGLLSAISGAAAYELAAGFPLTPDLSAWYAPATVYAALLITALAAYGLTVSLSRRKRLASGAPPAL